MPCPFSLNRDRICDLTSAHLKLRPRIVLIASISHASTKQLAKPVACHISFKPIRKGCKKIRHFLCIGGGRKRANYLICNDCLQVIPTGILLRMVTGLEVKRTTGNSINDPYTYPWILRTTQTVHVYE
jgi:hypothetical protein